MFINKIGFEHKETGLNCHDYGFINNKVKCIVDGCSEGLHSEVGSKLFCHLFNEGYSIDDIFNKIFATIDNTAQNIKNYLCFTILFIEETENSYVVNYCGDGYIIKQKQNDVIEFEKIDDGEYPKYYIYNYTDKKYLSHYKDGVEINQMTFLKSEHKNIGIATDGLRYIFGKEYENEFIELLEKGKESAIKRLINREYKHFKDDITIIL
ncbi:MAG TPA: hypothetical protein DEG71_09545 [Clostridiales bacterium]|nr:hypothetical protein [Clostridiales bacterium]